MDVIARTVPFYDPLVVAQALQTTAGIVLIMTALGHDETDVFSWFRAHALYRIHRHIHL